MLLHAAHVTFALLWNTESYALKRIFTVGVRTACKILQITSLFTVSNSSYIYRESSVAVGVSSTSDRSFLLNCYQPLLKK